VIGPLVEPESVPEWLRPLVKVSGEVDSKTFTRFSPPEDAYTRAAAVLILFGERSLHRAVTEFVAHFHSERNHQGKRNALLFPAPAALTARRHVRCRERLGGLLRYYCRAA